MPTPPQVPESFMDLQFPLCGIDQSRGFGQQMPRAMADGGQGQTTPFGENVRSYDALEQRGRGGSRPGLKKYLPGQINGAGLVQELSCLVGSGYNPPGQYAGSTGVSNISFIQANLGNDGGGAVPSASTAFLSNVTIGNLLIVLVEARFQAVASWAITDTQTNVYSQIGSILINGAVRLGVFYCIAKSTGACTVTITPNINANIGRLILEYHGVDATTPVEAFATNSGSAGNTSNTSTVAVDSPGRMVLATCVFNSGSVSAVSSPFVFRGAGIGNFPVADDLAAQAAESATFTNSLSGQVWVAMAVTFKPAAPTYTGGNYAILQGSESGRIVSLLGVSGGTVKVLPAGGTTWSPVTNGPTALSTTAVIRSTSLLQKLYYADGATWKYYDPVSNTIFPWTASAGSLPGSNLVPVDYPRLICTWRGRLVVSGIRSDGFNWFMSAVGDARNWDYFPTVFVTTQAVAGNNSRLGYLGDLVTCLIPFSDDVLVFGGDHTIYMMRGDPLTGGSIDLVSDNIGMAWGNPWCRGPDGTLFFFSNKMGIYNLVPGQKPMRMSQPIEQLLDGVDTGLNVIRLAWNDQWQGIHVFVTRRSAAMGTTHYFWEQRTGAWWTDVFARKEHNPLTCCVFDGNLESDRRTLIGSWDGYVRALAPDSLTDDGMPIESTVVLGPLLTKDLDTVMFKDVQGVLGVNSGEVDYSVYVGRTAEEALASDPIISGTWSGARNFTRHIRRSAHALWFKLSSTNPWALEGIRARIAGRGKVARRGV